MIFQQQQTWSVCSNSFLLFGGVSHCVRM